MLGEQFDLLRSYIDNYHNIYKLGYKSNDSMPDNLLPIIGNTIGFDLNNPTSGSLEDYLESNAGDEIGTKNYDISLEEDIKQFNLYLQNKGNTRKYKHIVKFIRI